MTVTPADFPAATIPLDIPEDPQSPFGVIALPNPAIPVTNRGVNRAYAAMLHHYRVPADASQRDKDTRPIGAQLDKALSIAVDRERWTIHADVVAIIGSAGDRYRTTPAFCEGPQWSSKGKPTRACKGALRAAVGMCNHQLAVELLRLAQELDPPVAVLTVADALATPAAAVAALAPALAAEPVAEPIAEPVAEPELSEIAAVTLPGWAMFALCGAITIKQKKVEAEDVQFLLSPDDGLISISSGSYTWSMPADFTTGAVVVLNAEGFDALWGAVRPAAMATESLRLTVATAADCTGTLTACGGDIRVTVPSAAVPL